MLEYTQECWHQNDSTNILKHIDDGSKGKLVVINMLRIQEWQTSMKVSKEKSW